MKEKYSLDNKSLNLNRVKYTHEKNCKFPVEKRIEVITKQLALGNMRLVADLTGVSYGLIRIWKGQPWWKEMELEIRNSRKARVDDKLNKIIDKALDTIEDRLDKGDFVYDQKKGEISRKPVSLKEARGAANDLMQRQIAVEKLAQEEKHLTNTSTIKDQLADLALQFAAFNTNRTVEVVSTPVVPLVQNQEIVSGDLPTQDTETEEYDDEDFEFQDEEVFDVLEDVPAEERSA